MRKRRKRRIRYLILLLFLTSVLLSSSTYAWFTANRVITVRTINVHVESSGGIEISADATNWKTILSPDDLTTVHDSTYPNSTNQIPYNMEPVSTGLEVDRSTGFLKMYHGVTDNNYDGEYVLTSTRMIETESNGVDSTGKFIAFDLFFKTSNEATLYMTKESKVSYLTEDREKGIASATRVAFVIEGVLPSGSEAEDIQALKNATSATTYIWEPNYDVHTAEGIANASNTYHITTSRINAERIVYDGVISEISKSNNVLLGNANQTSYPSYFKRVNVDYPTKKDFTDNVELFTLDAGISKVRIYMWIEGQDVDCENNASYDDIKFDLQLTINPS